MKKIKNVENVSPTSDETTQPEKRYFLVTTPCDYTPQADVVEQISSEKFEEYVRLNEDWLSDIARICGSQLHQKFYSDTSIQQEDKLELVNISRDLEATMEFLEHFYARVQRPELRNLEVMLNPTSKIPALSYVLEELLSWAGQTTTMYTQQADYQHAHLANSFFRKEDYALGFTDRKTLFMAGFLEKRLIMYANSLLPENEYWDAHVSASHYQEEQLLRRLGATFTSLIVSGYCNHRLDPEAFINAFKNIKEAMSLLMGKTNQNIGETIKRVKERNLISSSNVVYSTPYSMLFSQRVEEHNNPF